MKTASWKTIAIGFCFSFVVMGSVAQEKFLPSTVMKLSGDVRCSLDNGKTWQPVKLGQRLKPGLVIQTAAVGRAYILLDEDIHPLPRTSAVNGALFDPEQYPENLIGLLDDSALELTTLVRDEDIRAKIPSERTELKLLGGQMLINVKRLPTNSLFAIRCSTNAVLKMQDAVAQVGATGDFFVLKGTVNVSILENQFTKAIVASNRFDIATMTATNFYLSDHWKHDVWLAADPTYENWAAPPKR